MRALYKERIEKTLIKIEKTPLKYTLLRSRKHENRWLG